MRLLSRFGPQVTVDREFRPFFPVTGGRLA